MPVDISATKPIVDPRWATNGGTRAEPSSGQKNTGWTDGQRPPFNVMNWLQGVIYDWQQYLEDATDELDTGKLSRGGTQSMTGNLKPDGNSTRDLGDGAHAWRFGYFNTIIADEIDSVVFADWSTGTLLLDDLSVLTQVSSNLIPSVSGKDLGSSAKRWDAFLQSADNTGDSKALTVTTTSAPAKTTSIKDQINTVNTPKAWANIKVTGTNVATVEDGFNVTSVDATEQPTLGLIKITWAQDFADTKYVVIATPAINTGTSPPHIANSIDQTSGTSYPKAAGSTYIHLFDDAGADIDMSALGATIINVHVLAFGRQ